MAIVSATFAFSITAEEQVALQLDGSADPTLPESLIAGRSNTGTGATGFAPAITQQWFDTRTLVAGTDTIDLTALTKGVLADLDLTGLRVRTIIIKAAEGNSAALNVAAGAVNGYDLFGSGKSLEVNIGGTQASDLNVGAPIVAAVDLAIDITSADTTATYTVQILAG